MLPGTPIERLRGEEALRMVKRIGTAPFIAELHSEDERLATRESHAGTLFYALSFSRNGHAHHQAKEEYRCMFHY